MAKLAGRRTEALSNERRGGPSRLADELYRQHAGWLRSFLTRRFGKQQAEDLAQETFARLLMSGMGVKHPRAYLARAALNTAHDQFRREWAARRPTISAVTDKDYASSPADQLEALFHRQVVAQLPRNLRDVYVLSRFAGLTYSEIAATLGISVKAVEKRMSKALRICVAQFRA